MHESRSMMDSIFAQAVAAAMNGHTALSWAKLTYSKRAELIYAAMRKIDAAAPKGHSEEMA